MTWTSASTQYDEDEQATASFESGAAPPQSEDATQSSDAPATAPHASLTTAAADRCANCGSPLAADQRYCLHCGERRGRARFPVPAAATANTVTRTRTPRRPRLSSSSALIAGIGTLLLAMGVGVLIGHTSNAAKTGSPPQIVTVGGSGATAAPAVSSRPSKSKKSKKSRKAKSVAAANSGLVTKTVKNLPPSTVTQGQTCTSGEAGCQNGKFNGTFFGQ